MVVALLCLAGWACEATSPPVDSDEATPDDGASGGSATGSTGGSATGSTGGSATGGADASETGGTSSSGGASDSGGSSGVGGSESTGGSGSTALETVTDALDEFISYSQLVFSGDISLLGRLGNEPWGCDWSFAGDCRYTSNCGSFPYGPSPDAGPISLTSPDAAGTLAITFSDGAYDSDSSQFTPALGGGEGLLLSAAGGADLPAFEVEATFPLVILVDEPTGDLSAPIPVPATEDLTISFRRATAGVYLYALAANRVPGELEIPHLFQCASSGDPGTMVIPQEVLQAVDPGTTIEFYTFAVTPFEAGGNSYEFDVLAEVTDEAREDHFQLVTE